MAANRYTRYKINTLIKFGINSTACMLNVNPEDALLLLGRRRRRRRPQLRRQRRRPLGRGGHRDRRGRRFLDGGQRVRVGLDGAQGGVDPGWQFNRNILA